jgi:hypothetical protein
MYRARLKAADNEHRPLTSISNDVATLAWERRSRLDRPGQTPRIKEVCPCPYCLDASPFQTFAYKVKEQQRKEEGYESPDSDEEREQLLEEQRKHRRQARQAALKASQPLTIRDALEEAMPVHMRVKAMNTARTKKAKPKQTAVHDAATERQRLEEEIRSMEAAIAAQASFVSTDAAIERQRLEEEIRSMEAAIAAQQSLEEEIRAMEAAIAAQQAQQSQQSSVRVPRGPKSVVSKSPSMASRLVRVPRGPKSVASKSASMASRQRPRSGQSVQAPRRQMSAARKSPSVASRRRRPATKESAPPVPTSVQVITIVKVKAKPKVAAKPKRKPSQKTSADKSHACIIM